MLLASWNHAAMEAMVIVMVGSFLLHVVMSQAPRVAEVARGHARCHWCRYPLKWIGEAYSIVCSQCGHRQPWRKSPNV
jgi:LSD1 subclass zinc finger protein